MIRPDSEPGHYRPLACFGRVYGPFLHDLVRPMARATLGTAGPVKQTPGGCARFRTETPTCAADPCATTRPARLVRETHSTAGAASARDAGRAHDRAPALRFLPHEALDF